MFYGILAFYLLQRLSEMILSKKNFRSIEDRLIAAVDKREKSTMIILHSSWFFALFFEYQWHGVMNLGITEWIYLGILFLCQLIRLWTMLLLKESWVPYPVAYQSQKIRTTGPYRWIRHPNYLAVLIEVPLVALLGGCFVTAFIYGLLNFAFLKKRIRIEEESLESNEAYKRYRMRTKRLLPYILTLLVANFSWADSIGFTHKDFEAAKSALNYFKFTGSSTKLGFITTEFEGYAKQGKLEFKRDNANIVNIKLTIKSDSLDTDNSSRNEKMFDKCLDTKKFPEIIVSADQINLELPQQTVDAKMRVRDQEFPIKLEIKRDADRYYGESSFKLSDAKIPDPSIAVASVKDEFKINFQVEIQK